MKQTFHYIVLNQTLQKIKTKQKTKLNGIIALYKDNSTSKLPQYQSWKKIVFLVTETNTFEKKTSKIIFLIKPCSEIRCTLPKLNKIFVNFVQVSFEIAAFLWLSLWRKILWTNADQTSPFLHASERNYPSSLYRPDDGV